MIKDPSLILTFTANDLEAGHESVQTITGEDLLTRSISIEHRLLDGLKPSSDKAEISIRKGAPVTEDIIHTEGYIHAAGMVLLLGLMAFVMLNDIVRIVTG